VCVESRSLDCDGGQLMRITRIVVALVLGASSAVVGLLGLGVTAAQASPNGPYICSGGNIAPGTYASVTVTGTCYVPQGSVVIHGNLIIAPGALLDAVSPAPPAPTGSALPGEVSVSGNVIVGRGAVLGLGCSPSVCTDSTNDSVGGNIVGSQALAVIVHGVTIGGSVVVSGGGGGVTCTPPPLFLTDPQLAGPAYGDFENNVISGNLTVISVRSCWFGALRNEIGGNVVYAGNVYADPDANEILNNTVDANMICLFNSPAVQVGDSMAPPNVVSGLALGECAPPISVRP
jgi:hypothetical protein